MRSNKKAIVTLTVGEKHQRLFDRYCRDNWTEYCRAHGFDLIVIPDPLDQTERAQNRPIAWQKLLILSQPWAASYEQILWLDSDLVINNALAPDVCKSVPVEKIGAVDAFSIPSRHEYLKLSRLPASPMWSNLWESPRDYFQQCLKKPDYEALLRTMPTIDHVVQGGVLVCSALHHRDAFERAYFRHEDDQTTNQGEQPAMSVEWMKEDLVCWLPAEFNFCVSPAIALYYAFLADHRDATPALRACAIRNIFNMGYFVHFAGCHELMDLLSPMADSVQP